MHYMKVLIYWASRKQACVALSSSEAELHALSEGAKEIKFIYYALKSVGVDIPLPVTVRVDNVGAIFMAENPNTSPRTRHIDIRYRFVKEMIVDGFIVLKFVKSKENLSDGLTKNITAEIYKSHTKEYLMKKDGVD